jgi:FkbM family methyltransferase
MNNYANLIIEKTNINPNIILEIGSRDGHDAEILRSRFELNGKNVYVVEPNPNQQQYIKNIYPNFNIIPFAIYNKNGVMKFNKVNDYDLIGISSLLDREDHIYSNINSEIIDVDVINGDGLMDLLGVDVDLCKIDVEGATYEVLESFTNISRIKSMHIECEHKEIWNGQKLYDDVKELLISKGYIEIYFNYVNGVPIQSDSIWVLKNYIK